MADDLTAAPSPVSAAASRTTGSAVDLASDVRRRRLALVGGLALTLGALALLAIGRTWGSGESGFVTARSIDAPLLWLTVAALGALVLWSVRQASRGRTALDVLGWVLVPVVILAALRFGLAPNAHDGSQRRPSPDGSRTLVIEPVSSVLDPVWELRVETGYGLTRRYRVLDCVNGDWSNIERAQWISPTTAKVVHRSSDKATGEEATTLTFSGADAEHVAMTGHGLDACAGDTPTSTR